MFLNLFYNNYIFFVEIGLLLYYISICCICIVYKFRVFILLIGIWIEVVKIGLFVIL